MLVVKASHAIIYARPPPPPTVRDEAVSVLMDKSVHICFSILICTQWRRSKCVMLSGSVASQLFEMTTKLYCDQPPIWTHWFIDLWGFDDHTAQKTSNWSLMSGRNCESNLRRTLLPLGSPTSQRPLT